MLLLPADRARGLSEVEERVYTAVATLETRGQVPYPAVIAEEAGLTEAELDAPLSTLAQKDLLHREDTPVEGLNFGPRWCARQPA